MTSFQLCCGCQNPSTCRRKDEVSLQPPFENRPLSSQAHITMRRAVATTFSIEDSPELAAVDDGLRKLGKAPANCASIVATVKDAQQSQAEVPAWKQSLKSAGVAVGGDELERVLLTHAVRESLPKIESLRVHPAVMGLMQKECSAFSKPPSRGPQLLTGTDSFVTACKIALASQICCRSVRLGDLRTPANVAP